MPLFIAISTACPHCSLLLLYRSNAHQAARRDHRRPFQQLQGERVRLRCGLTAPVAYAQPLACFTLQNDDMSQNLDAEMAAIEAEARGRLSRTRRSDVAALQPASLTLALPCPSLLLPICRWASWSS